VTRIVAGTARGRRLAVPPGSGTRPTSDRAREGLFSSLLAMVGPLDGLRVADLYAGSGAVGLEAASRGAAHVLLVESDRRAAAVAQSNVDVVGPPSAAVRTARVEALVAAAPPGGAFDVVFLDPPYATTEEEVDAVLSALVEHGWLATGAVVVAERPTRRTTLTWPDGLVGDRERSYGEGTLWYGRAVRGNVSTPAGS
jgi:16S rRNA (guanine966-N2)-methyltransferase